jgi:tRNA-guanine family transglycosylase
MKTRFGEHLRRVMGFKGPVMLDSGGFVLSKNPIAKWNVHDVAALFQQVEADVYVSLDVPPGMGDSLRMRRSKIHRTSENFSILRDRFPHKTIMPVVHGRTLNEIELSLKLIDGMLGSLKWIGIGGMVPLIQHRSVSGLIDQPETFLGKAVRLVRLAAPSARIHVFGAGGTRTFPAIIALGADSADSIGWRLAAGFGRIFLPLKSQRTIAENGKCPRGRLVEETDIVQISECNCPTCRDRSLQNRLRTLRDHFYHRAIHNAWTTVFQYRYWPPPDILADAVRHGLVGLRWADAMRNA